MAALVGIIMGSKSDWETLSHAAATLDRLNVPYEVRVVSAHRTPDLLFEYAESAARRGLQVIIAGAGGAAHLPGMTASKTPLPVLGVPVESKSLKGLDSLLSIVQMPAGIPVGTLAIGKAGAINAALLATTILGTSRPRYRAAIERFREEQTREVLSQADPRTAAAGAGLAMVLARQDEPKEPAGVQSCATPAQSSERAIVPAPPRAGRSPGNRSAKAAARKKRAGRGRRRGGKA